MSIRLMRKFLDLDVNAELFQIRLVFRFIHGIFHRVNFVHCNDAAMINCEQACKALVQSYAQTGCGKIVKGSKVKYSWEASSCSSGLSAMRNIHVLEYKLNFFFLRY